MIKTEYDQLKKSTKKRLVIMTFLWLFSTIAFIILMTDFFKEPPFRSNYIAFYIVLFISTLAIAKIYSDYYRIKKENKL